MWELPQIYHFLQLAKNALSISHLSMFEVERMLLLPKASQQLTHILTRLLSSSAILKSSQDTLPPMSYKFWSNIVLGKLKFWFKMSELNDHNFKKVFDCTGVEPKFWKVFPCLADFENKEFMDLNFRQRVWLLKTLCDTASHHNKHVLAEIQSHPPENQTEALLGVDRHGARYVYFPHFLNSDIRVYRFCVGKPNFSINLQIKTEIKMENRPRNPALRCKKRRRNMWNKGVIPPRTKRRDKRREQVVALNNFSVSSSPILDDNSMSNEVSWDSKSPMISEQSETPIEDTDIPNENLMEHDNEDINNCINDEVDNESKMEDALLNGENEESKIEDALLSEVDGESRVDEVQAESKVIDDLADEIHAESKLEDELLDEFDADSKIDGVFGLDGDDSESKTDEAHIESKSDDAFVDAVDGECKIEDIYLDTVDTDSKINDALLDEVDEESGINVGLLGEGEEELDETSADNRDETLNHLFDSEDAITKSPEAERTLTDLDYFSKSSKTDDEKLQEMNFLISGDSNEKSNISVNNSKSDDEKLCESQKCDNSVNDKAVDDLLESEDVENSQNADPEDEKNSDVEENSKVVKLSNRLSIDISHLKDVRIYLDQADVKLPSEESCNNSGRESKTEELDLQQSAIFSSDQWIAKDLNKLLSEMPISEFKLVADSVDAFEKLIESMKSEDSEFGGVVESPARPECENLLLQRMSALLESLQDVEEEIVGSAREARHRLYEDWSNFGHSSSEDPDSSQDDGMSSDWVIGSDGCPLPKSFKDTSLHDESSSSASSGEDENLQELLVRSVRRTTRSQIKREDETHADMVKKETSEQDVSDESGKSEEESRPPKRVLRTRGVSSYVGHLFDDYDSDADMLTGWVDIEAVYAESVKIAQQQQQQQQQEQHDEAEQNNVSSPNKASTSHSYEEDSDQEWILPSNRKRKRRSSKRKKDNDKSRPHSGESEIPSEDQQSTPGSAPLEQDHELQSNDEQDKPKDELPKEESTEKKEKENEKQVVLPPKPPDVPIPLPKIKVANLACEPREVPLEHLLKIENLESLHSTLNIKEEANPLDENNHMNNSNILQQNYIVASSGQPAVANYYMMPQPPAASNVMQQPHSYLQPPQYAPQVVNQPAMQSGGAYYYQPNQNYVMPNQAGYVAPQQPYMPNHQPPMMYHHQPQPQPRQVIPQQVMPRQNYVPYVPNQAIRHVRPPAGQPRLVNNIHQPINNPALRHPTRPMMGQPRIINSTTFNPPPPYQNTRMRMTNYVGRATQSFRPNVPAASNAVYRAPAVRPPNYPRIRVPNQVANQAPRRYAPPLQSQPQRLSQQVQRPATQPRPRSAGAPKTTSLIVLSDDDDEIEMIVTDKPSTLKSKSVRSLQQKQEQEVKAKLKMHPQLLQRMSEGGISISPVKPKPKTPTTVAGTQLVVVVNETGSHYALALPNGSKLILTPEQVAQIRASNDGKLVL